MSKHLTKSDFSDFIRDGYALVDFYAEWCGPCKMMGPIIDELANENNGFKVAKVNVDEQGELSQQFNVTSIPTVVLFNEGKKIAVFNGFRPKQSIIDFVNENKK